MSCAYSFQAFSSARQNRKCGSRQRRTPCVAALDSSGTVLLTREQGKNKALAERLTALNIPHREVPMVSTEEAEDTAALPEVLQTGDPFDWIVLTSPEAAAVFLSAWAEAGEPDVSIACVGKGTSRIIELAARPDRLVINFMPTIANAVHLSAELPMLGKPLPTVLYPASARAASTLQDGLAERGFAVTRLNTYTTVSVSELAPEQLEAAKTCAVVSVASPSSLKAWVGLVGLDVATTIPVACIGSTSGQAALKLGLQSKRVFWDKYPGLDGFVRSIEKALECSKVPSA